MTKSAGSIGQLAENIVNQVKSEKLTKIAEYQLIKQASTEPPKTEIGRTLAKLAEEVRTQKLGISLEDLNSFLTEVSNAG